MPISEPLQNALLQSAAKVVISRLRGMGTPAELGLPDDPLLAQPSGCFVSLHRGDTHALRGCIGIVESPNPLRQSLVGAAEGVLTDPRFSGEPITAFELGQLDIEVTILGPLTPAQSPMHFDPMLHGIVLTVAGRSGLFLPQVARQTGWPKEQLLNRLSYEKLGLAPLAWRQPGAMLRTFTADVIGPRPVREFMA